MSRRLRLLGFLTAGCAGLVVSCGGGSEAESTKPEAWQRKSALPTKTITPVDNVPVPVALTEQDLEDYKKADAPTRIRMVQKGIVQLITAPTEIRYEKTARELAFIRMPDGPLSGRLVVVDAEFVK
jgi:hypothetical protein